MRIAVVRIEVEVVGAVALAARVTANGDRALVIMCYRFFPFRAPARRPGWDRMRVDGRRFTAAFGDVAAADKAHAGVIEVVAVEIVYRHRAAATAGEGIEYLVREEESDPAAHLVRIIAADHTS